MLQLLYRARARDIQQLPSKQAPSANRDAEHRSAVATLTCTRSSATCLPLLDLYHRKSATTRAAGNGAGARMFPATPFRSQPRFPLTASASTGQRARVEADPHGDRLGVRRLRRIQVRVQRRSAGGGPGGWPPGIAPWRDAPPRSGRAATVAGLRGGPSAGCGQSMVLNYGWLRRGFPGLMPNSGKSAVVAM